MVRSLVGGANVVLALAVTLQSCGRMDPVPNPVANRGTPAPEIVGEDIDGVPFRLSEYRGKVVVLDFWGDW
jgi:hypothetical protein